MTVDWRAGGVPGRARRVLSRPLPVRVPQGVYRLRDVLLYRPAPPAASPGKIGLIYVNGSAKPAQFSHDQLLKDGFPFPTLIPQMLA